MQIEVRRDPSSAHCTPGEMWIDGTFECYTLEDMVREIPGRPVAEWKVKAETAIPAGRFQVTITFSQRFQKETPLLLGVPGFDAIRIHSGNTDKDTEGCILVGRNRVPGNPDDIINSRVAFDAVMAKIRRAYTAKEPIWITVSKGNAHAAVAGTTTL